MAEIWEPLMGWSGKKTDIWSLSEVWSLLLSPKHVSKGGLNKAETVTTDIYSLFLRRAASLDVSLEKSLLDLLQ